MKQLIADIKTRLQEQVTGLRYIDEDWGQLDYNSPDFPTKWPCAIVAVNQAQWTNQGRLTQTGIAEVSIRFADMRLSNTNPKAPVGQRNAANTIFDIMALAFKNLHGWTASSANGPLTRTQTRKVNRDDGIREFEVIYSVQLHDEEARPVSTAYPMTPEKITFQMGLVAPGSGELTPPWPGSGGIIPPDPDPDPIPGGGMDGEFTEILLNDTTLDLTQVDSEKVKFVCSDSENPTDINYFGLGVAGQFKIIWFKLTYPNVLQLHAKMNYEMEGAAIIGVNQGSLVVYDSFYFKEVMFIATCMGGNNWVLTALGGADANTFALMTKSDAKIAEKQFYPIEISTVAFFQLKNNFGLIPSQWYLLNDFISEVTDCEQIFVFATSLNDFYRECISQLFPSQKVWLNGSEVYELYFEYGYSMESMPFEFTSKNVLTFTTWFQFIERKERGLLTFNILTASTGGENIELTTENEGTLWQYDSTLHTITLLGEYASGNFSFLNLTLIEGSSLNYSLQFLCISSRFSELVPGSKILNTPTGTLTTSTVQDAINQLDTLKAPKESPVFTTLIKTPQIVGGDDVNSKIIHKSTSGVGTPGEIAHQFAGGTNGATVAMTILNNGKIGFGTVTPNSKYQLNGSLSLPLTAKATAYTLTETDFTVNCIAQTFALTLPTAVGCPGRIYVMKNSGSGTISINTTSGQTIDGSGSGVITLIQYDMIIVQSTGSNWIIISKK